MHSLLNRKHLQGAKESLGKIKDCNMPKGKGTYGNKVGRPKKKKSKRKKKKMGR